MHKGKRPGVGGAGPTKDITSNCDPSDNAIAKYSQAEFRPPDPDITQTDTAAVVVPPLKKQADELIALADAAELFHTAAGDAYADVRVCRHRETYGVRSKLFRFWLRHRFYELRKGAPSSEAMTSALASIEARALFDGPERRVNVRVAEHDGKLYVDLADAQWRAIEIDPGGWRPIMSPPVRFRRASGMLALPQPVGGGSIDALRPLLNVRDEDFILVVAWLLAALRPHGPYPVLALAGEQGSAKSTLSALLRALIDPNVAPLRALPREDRDLFIAANNAHVLSFDNVSGLPAWTSDTLCRLATGGGFATRQLYSDDSEMIFDAMRPILLNGIADVAVRPDLVDRAIILNLETIDESMRRPEKELWAAFEAARPDILGALLDAVAHGLSRLDRMVVTRLPRMADFYTWSTACEPAMWPEGTFASAYDTNRETAVAGTIEADFVAMAVRSFMNDRNTWIGSASELLTALGLLISDTQHRRKEWPSLPHHLTGRLRRVAPVLRKVGIKIDFRREGKQGARAIHISHLGQPEFEGERASEASAAAPMKDINDLGLTLTEGRASASASVNPADDDADAPADVEDHMRVSHNALKTQPTDATDAADAEIDCQSGGRRAAST